MPEWKKKTKNREIILCHVCNARRLSRLFTTTYQPNQKNESAIHKLVRSIRLSPLPKNEIRFLSRDFQDRLREDGVGPCKPRTRIIVDISHVDGLVDQTEQTGVADQVDRVHDLRVVVGGLCLD